MGKARQIGSGGSGAVKNSIVEQFLAESETIDANTFVEFVNKTTVSGGVKVNKNNSLHCSCVKLDDNRVLQLSAISGKLYAEIVKISNGTIEYGTTLQLTIAASTSAYCVQAVKVTESTVFALASMAQDYVQGIFLNIDNMTITQTSGQTLNLNIGNYYYFRILLFSQTKVLVQTSGGYLHLLTLTGTTVSITSSLRYCADTYKNAGGVVGITKLSDSKVLISYSRYYGYNTSYDFLAFSVVNVVSDSLEIAKTLETDIGTCGNDNAIDLGNGSLCMLMLRYEYSSSTYVPGYWGFVVRVVDNEIIIGSPVYIKSTKESYFLSLVPLDNNTFYISTYSYTKDGSNQLYVVPIRIIDGILIVGEPLNTTSLSTGSGFNSMVTFNDYVLAIYSTSTALFNTTGSIVKIKKSKSIIHGITKTKATTSAKGKVCLLP